MKPYEVGVGGGGLHMDTHKGVNGGKIQVICASIFFIYQVALLGVFDHCVKNNQPHPLSSCIYTF